MIANMAMWMPLFLCRLGAIRWIRIPAAAHSPLTHTEG